MHFSSFLNRITGASEFSPRFRHSLFSVLHRCIDRIHLGHCPKSASLKTGCPKIYQKDQNKLMYRDLSLKISNVSESDVLPGLFASPSLKRYPRPTTSSNQQHRSPEYLTRPGSAFGLQPCGHTHSDQGSAKDKSLRGIGLTIYVMLQINK